MLYISERNRAVATVPAFIECYDEGVIAFPPDPYFFYWLGGVARIVFARIANITNGKYFAIRQTFEGMDFSFAC
jgi:hypothetical protein